MNTRPPTDYIKTLINDKTDQIKSAENDIKNNVNVDNAEEQLTLGAISLINAINALVGRNALTDDDIEKIIIQAKKAAGL